MVEPQFKNNFYVNEIKDMTYFACSQSPVAASCYDLCEDSPAGIPAIELAWRQIQEPQQPSQPMSSGAGILLTILPSQFPHR
jgi:hypothetical protein